AGRGGEAWRPRWRVLVESQAVHRVAASDDRQRVGDDRQMRPGRVAVDRGRGSLWDEIVVVRRLVVDLRDHAAGRGAERVLWADVRISASSEEADIDARPVRGAPDLVKRPVVSSEQRSRGAERRNTWGSGLGVDVTRPLHLRRPRMMSRPVLTV